MVRVDDGRRPAEVGDGVRDAHALAEGHDTDFALEEVDVKLEEDVAGNFLLCKGISIKPGHKRDSTYR